MVTEHTLPLGPAGELSRLHRDPCVNLRTFASPMAALRQLVLKAAPARLASLKDELLLAEKSPLSFHGTAPPIPVPSVLDIP